jgi:PiT family inorganic phosphate transporter
MNELALVVLIVVMALLFDFFNGFNDAANSIATIVATKVLTPFQAVAWAAFFNFISAFGFGTAVAKTIGSGMVHSEMVTPLVVLAGLVGAIFWVALASRLGLPVSASHSLVGGYGGAAVAHAGLIMGWEKSLSVLNAGNWLTMAVFIFVAPLLGLLGGGGLMIATAWLFRKHSRAQMDVYFRKLQLISSAAFSFSHGTNDAQKTMGVIVAALFATGHSQSMEIPLWVILSAHAAIALGTLFGGWRVIRTMGDRLTKLKPLGGFCAETGGAATVMFAASLGVPASTTHTIAGAIAGVGVVRRVRAVRWGQATDIVGAWVLTLPITIAVGAGTYLLVYWLAL